MPGIEITDEKIHMIQKDTIPTVKLAILFNDVKKQQIEVSLKNLKYPNEIVSTISNVVSLQNFFDSSVTDQKVREFRRVAGKYAIPTLDLIDVMDKPVNVDKIKQFLENIKDAPIKPPVTGYDLIALGYKPGPEFKKILDLIQNKFDENPNISREDLLSLANKNK